MRALVARHLDGPAAVELIDTPIPTPAAGQVLVKVVAAAVNPVDVAITTGALLDHGLTAAREQFGLGWDVAGVVDATGPGVEMPVGTAVVGVADLLGRSLKAHAEYVVLDASAVTRAPAGLALDAASTFGLNALTAYQVLRRIALRSGQTVLVTGAAGGVGGYAVELAKHSGLTVVATAGAEDEELVRSLGADHFVPRSADLAAAVRALVPGGVDGLVDAAVVGAAAQEAVRNGGVHAHVVGGPAPTPLRGITVFQVFIEANQSDLVELVRLVEDGVISTRVAGRYTLADGPTAYARLAKGGVRGRLVLTP